MSRVECKLQNYLQCYITNRKGCLVRPCGECSLSASAVLQYNRQSTADNVEGSYGYCHDNDWKIN